MIIRGIVITGHSGSGKDAVMRDLGARDSRFGRVPAVTTRSRRDDDEPGVYDYLSEKQFEELHRADALLISAEYRSKHYGIRKADFARVAELYECPVLVLTPDSAVSVAGDWSNRRDVMQRTGDRFLSFFLSAPEAELDRRLANRGTKQAGLEIARAQREEEREYASRCFAQIENRQIADSAELIRSVWTYRQTGGVLPARLIHLMFRCGQLLEGARDENISGASYDLSLGDEYFYQGRILHLSDKEPFLLIQPYDYAIITSHEVARLPLNIAARFDLSVGLFSQGVILSNGPQVDPGFVGPLFCLVFNTSSSPVLLKRRQHYATLEFHQLVEPTFKYEGRYRGKSLIGYLPQNATRGAISKLQEEIESVRKSTEQFHNTVLAFLSLVLAVIALLIAILFR